MTVKELVDSMTALRAEIAEMKKPTQEQKREAVEELKKEAKDDPNAARFLQFLKHGAVVYEREAEDAKDRGAGLRAARILRAYGAAGGRVERVPAVLADVYGDKALADSVSKSMDTATPTGGGFLVAEAFSEEIIPLLRAQAVAFKLGARNYPMASAVEHIPTQDAASSAFWVGETAAPTHSQPKTGRKTMTEKFLAAKVAYSQALLRSSRPAADAFVRDDVVTVMGLKLDDTVFTGAGTENTPLGIDNAGVQTFDFASKPTLIKTVSTIEKLETANVPLLAPGWAFNSAAWREFLLVVDNNGQPLFMREMLESDTLLGARFEKANQIATGTDVNKKTTIYFGSWDNVWIGDRGGLQVMVSEEAAYTDSTGTLVSAAERRETLLLVHLATDILIRQLNAFVRGTNFHTA